jgi:glucosylceramidase
MICAGGDARTVTYNPEFFVIKHVSHFVDPGAVVLGLSGPWTWNALAFENPDKTTVLVVHNPFKENRPLTFTRGAEHYRAELAPESFNTLVI